MDQGDGRTWQDPLRHSPGASRVWVRALGGRQSGSEGKA
jgi:hypothetical protein